MKTRTIVAGMMIVAGLGIVVEAQEQEAARLQAVASELRQSLVTRREPLESRLVKGQPYSAEIVTEFVQTLADGNRIVQRTTGRVHRDSEGRVRREEDGANGPATISISDPVAGTGLVLDPVNHTARKTNGLPLFRAAAGSIYNFTLLTERPRVAAAAPAAAAAAPSTGAQPTAATVVARGGRGGARGGGTSTAGPVEERIENRMIEGVLASGVRRTTTIAKGAIGNEQPIRIVSEEWTSIDLQVLVMTDMNDPRSGRSTYRLLKVSRGEPDAGLFQVPPGYTELPAAGGGGRARGGGGGGRGGGQ